MPGSQSESPTVKRRYGLDTLRPVTIKKLLEAHLPNPDAEHFIIDNAEATQVTFVGQVRNISSQATNTTYKLDDGTGIIEVKTWKDVEADQDPDHPNNHKVQPTEQAYVRVWGRLKQFNNKRHLGAQIIRPIQDLNEIQYHLLEATAVHLHFTRGPPESLQAKGGANGAANGEYGVQQQNGGGGLPPGCSMAARKVYQCLRETVQSNEGLHVQDIAGRLNMDVSEVEKGGAELTNHGVIYTTVDDHTWAVLDLDM
jgi:replication factor A2